MTRTYKSTIAILIAGMMWFIGGMLCANEVAAVDVNAIAAKVNGVAVSRSELQARINRFIPPGTYHGEMGVDRQKRYRAPALEELVNEELMFQEAKRRGIKIDSREVSEVYELRRSKFKDDSSFASALKNAGISTEEYRRMIEKEILVPRFREDVVRAQASYSDAELKEHYEKNKGNFMRPQGYRVGHIIIKVAPNVSQEVRDELKGKAESVFKRVKAGEDFYTLAYENSEDDYRVKGGDLGWVHGGRMLPDIEKEIKTMDVGEIRMIESLYGYHIIELRDKRPAEQMTFDQMKDTLKDKLEAKRYKDVESKIIKQLREKAKVEYLNSSDNTNQE